MRQIHHWAALLFVAAIIGAHDARLLHRRVPQAARAQLADRRRAAAARHARGLRRLLAARRPALRHRPAHRRRASSSRSRWSAPTCRSSCSAASSRATTIIPRLYTCTSCCCPGIILALIRAHLMLICLPEAHPVARPGPDRTTTSSATRSAGLRGQGRRLLLHRLRRDRAAGGGLCTINPIWRTGPYDPAQVTAGSQPDWYMGFADGALRLMPQPGDPRLGPHVLAGTC